MPAPFAELRKYLHYNALLVWRTKAFWTRALLCWLVGAIVLVYDESSSFDMRLKIRGSHRAPSRVLLVDVNDRDWAGIDPETRNVLRPLKEVITLTDAYFWNPRSWEKILSRVLSGQPSAVGVTLFFGDNVQTLRRSSWISPPAREVFEDPRIVWGADVDTSGRLLTPIFASTYNGNVGLRGFHSDEDGTIRRFSTSRVQVPHMAARLATIAEPRLAGLIDARYPTAALINFRGGADAFDVVGAADIIEGRIAPEVFRDRIVVIGSLDSPGEQLQTPLGRMSRAEVIANAADNIVAGRTIHRWPTLVYFVLLGLIMAAAIWILTTYPQSVTLVAFMMFAILWSAASVWAFDTAYFWLPLFSPLAQLTLTCIVFLSYQLAINERRTWRLEQEQHYLSEIEQLKTNFVSMMSHDLKTPIAKIQAICDRLLASAANPEMTLDLKSLRRSSDELHRYIQSILQVTKVEAKDFQIKMEVTDINDDIERVIARLQPLARERGIRLETKLEPMFSIEADTTLIQEVIHNLVENAIKYTSAPNAGAAGPASAPQGRVTVTSQEKDDNVWVVVEDTGPGIDPEDQKNIWRKFTRGRQQIAGGSESVKGTGLGLYLVKYFIELHGGQVFLESSLGKGTRIGFSIPIAAEAASQENPASASASGEDATGLDGNVDVGDGTGGKGTEPTRAQEQT